jgi:hypothetical protein
MSPRVSALAAAVVSLVAIFLAYSIWLRPGTDAPPVAPGAAAEGEPVAPGEPLAPPTGEPVLRIRGVSRGNVGSHTTAIDFATLDKLGVEELTVHEPFLKRDVTFTGVWMRDLLNRAGVGADARRLYLHALDDYHVELSVSDVAATGFLAVRAGGEPMEIADGGPIRLVFSSDDGVAAITDNWIWSIDSIRAIR